MNLKFLALAGSLYCAANAAVTINFSVDSVYTSAGAAVPTTGLGLIIADTTGDGFGQINAGSISVGSLLGSSDLVVFSADFSTFGTDGVWFVAATDLSFSNSWNGNDKLAFVWFPTLTSGSSTVQNGLEYGLLADASWVTPSDGGSNENTYQIISSGGNGFFGANANTLQLTNSQARSILSVGGVAIPEPSSFAALAGLGILGVVATRRRRSA